MKDEISSDIRSQRGLAIAQANKDSIKALVGAKYLVPSATSNGSRYVVDAKRESCSCLDWSKLGSHGRPHRCKHIWAVIYVKRLPDGSDLIMQDQPKKTYPRDWRATNACRTLIPSLGPILLVEAIDTLDLPPPQTGKRGRPPVSDRDILVASGLRTWAGETAGGAVDEMKKLCALGSISMARVPSYNTLLERFARPELMPHLHRLLAITAHPCLVFEKDFAVDGTSFGSSRYDCYFTQKHGDPAQRRPPTKRHRWVDAKIVYGANTHVIVAVQITKESASEARCMPELLRRAIANGARIGDWCGDKAYMADYNIKAVEDAGGRPYFDWPDHVKGRDKKKPALYRLRKTFEADEDLYWARYDRTRPLAETGNQMLKERFGHYLRSRTPDAQYAESMLRCVCHNVACLVMAVKELNVDPRYWVPDVATLPDFGSTVPPEITRQKLTGVGSTTQENE